MKLVRKLSELPAGNDSYVLIPLVVTIVAGAFLTDAETLAATVLTCGLFALPGFLVCMTFMASRTRAALYGFPLGYSLTSLLIIAVVGFRGWDMRSVALCYLLGLGALLAVVVVMRRSAQGSPPAVERGPEPPLPLLVALGLTIAVVAVFIPLAHAGILTPRGYAFAGLFGHDFLLRAVDSVALANAIPADNYFFNGVKTVNYYDLWYILPAAIYNLRGQHVAATQIVALVSLLNVPIFGALLFYTLERLVRTTSAAPAHPLRLSTIFILLLIFSYSYHWLVFFVTRVLDVSTVPVLARLATQMGPVSTSWFKDLLFQPHSVLALMQFLAAMHLALLPGIRLRGMWLGILLGSMLLTDTVIFLVAGSAFGLWYLSRTGLRQRLPEVAAVGVTGAAVVALAFATKIFGTPAYSNKVIISPYWTAIGALPALLPLWLGALPVFALLALRQRPPVMFEQRRLLLLLLLTSLFFMLFVTEILEGNVFLRKSLMTLRLPLFMLAATYLYALPLEKMRRLPLVLLALAVPTAFTDIYAASRTDDERYTTYLTVDEMAAAVWLQNHTAPDVVVQPLVEYSGFFDYSPTVCFAYRKAALGIWKMAYQRYPDRRGISQRVREIQKLFSTTSDDERASLARALQIGYIFIGPRERQRFPGVDLRFAADKLHFEEAYSSTSVKIYRASS